MLLKHKTDKMTRKLLEIYIDMFLDLLLFMISVFIKRHFLDVYFIYFRMWCLSWMMKKQIMWN